MENITDKRQRLSKELGLPTCRSCSTPDLLNGGNGGPVVAKLVIGIHPETLTANYSLSRPLTQHEYYYCSSCTEGLFTCLVRVFTGHTELTGDDFLTRPQPDQGIFDPSLGHFITYTEHPTDEGNRFVLQFSQKVFLDIYNKLPGRLDLRRLNGINGIL